MSAHFASSLTKLHPAGTALSMWLSHPLRGCWVTLEDTVQKQIFLSIKGASAFLL